MFNKSQTIQYKDKAGKIKSQLFYLVTEFAYFDSVADSWLKTPVTRQQAPGDRNQNTRERSSGNTHI